MPHYPKYTLIAVCISTFFQLTTSPEFLNQIQIGPQHDVEVVQFTPSAQNASIPLLPLPVLNMQPHALNSTALAELFSLALPDYTNSETDDNRVHSESVSNQQPIVMDDEGESPSIMADGTSMQSGKTADGSGLWWQSSGILTSGGCPEEVLIENCYTLQLSGNPKQHLDPGGRTPRQRIEFLTHL